MRTAVTQVHREKERSTRNPTAAIIRPASVQYARRSAEVERAALFRPTLAGCPLLRVQFHQGKLPMTNITGTGWKNGGGFPPGDSGYGIKIDETLDRRRYFARGQIKLHLDGFPNPIFVNIDKKSFWTPSCGELISVEIGRWMRAKGLIPWTSGNPPKFTLAAISPREFEIRLSSRD